jgi:hypothetical protein
LDRWYVFVAEDEVQQGTEECTVEIYIGKTSSERCCRKCREVTWYMSSFESYSTLNDEHTSDNRCLIREVVELNAGETLYNITVRL